jgi:hypothetical protein
MVMLKRMAVLAGLAFVVAAGAAQARELPYVEGQSMPEGARPGEAWCLYQYPPVYDVVYDDVEIRPATNFTKPVPAEYGRKTDTHVLEPEYQVGQPVATQWQNTVQEYEYRPAYQELQVRPAQWREVQREVVVCPAYEEKYWEHAEFAVENRTFEIAPARRELRRVPCNDGTQVDCYVYDDVPAQVQTVAIKTLVKPGRAATRAVPEKKAMITVCELVAAATTRAVDVPAVARSYQVGVPIAAELQMTTIPRKQFQVTSVVVEKAASTEVVTLPAEKRQVQRQVLKTPGRIVWRLQAEAVPPPVSAIKADTESDYGSVPGSVALAPAR